MIGKDRNDKCQSSKNKVAGRNKWWDSGDDIGVYLGLYKDYLGLSRDNGKENGNYHRIWAVGRGSVGLRGAGRCGLVAAWRCGSMAAHSVAAWQTSGFGLVARHSGGEGDDDDDDDGDDDDVLFCQQPRTKQRLCAAAFVGIPTCMTTARELL